jgi:uncharacterized protein (TIGR02271 family)
MNDRENRDPRPDAAEPDMERRVPVVEEELVADTRQVKTGSVRVQKHVTRQVRQIDTPLLRETVEVRRVEVNRVVDSPPPVRREGETIIVPVVEEELIVTKRLVLKEEIHLVKRRTRDKTTQEVELNRETAEIQRLDADGRIIDVAPQPRRARREPLLKSRRRSLLE